MYYFEILPEELIEIIIFKLVQDDVPNIKDANIYDYPKDFWKNMFINKFKSMYDNTNFPERIYNHVINKIFKTNRLVIFKDTYNYYELYLGCLNKNFKDIINNDILSKCTENEYNKNKYLDGMANFMYELCFYNTPNIDMFMFLRNLFSDSLYDIHFLVCINKNLNLIIHTEIFDIYMKIVSGIKFTDPDHVPTIIELWSNIIIENPTLIPKFEKILSSLISQFTKILFKQFIKTACRYLSFEGTRAFYNLKVIQEF
jgi:hypothetical protein